MSGSLQHQVIVITGASSGIGLATAFEAARRGATVVLAARNADDLEQAAENIRRLGGTALAVPTDVTQLEQVEQLALATVEAFGRIDSWISNAGVSLYGTFMECSLQDFRQVMETNFMGQVHCVRVALPLLEETGGSMICVGSALSDRGVPLQGAYCASKHALKGWLDAVRVELAKNHSRVRITLVKPSSINTPLFNKAKTLMGVMPQPIPPIYDPQIAASAILRAIHTGDRDVYIGGAGKLLSVAERLSPRLLDLQQRYGGFKSQKTAWPKPDDAPSNLYNPVATDGGVEGDFIDRAKSHSLYQRVSRHTGSLVLGALVVAWTVMARRAGSAHQHEGRRSRPHRR